MPGKDEKPTNPINEDEMAKRRARYHKKIREFEASFPEMGSYISAIELAYMKHFEKTLDDDINLFKAFEHVRRCDVCWKKVERARNSDKCYAPQSDIQKYRISKVV